MEKKVVNIFYLGIAYGERFRGGGKERKAGLPVRVLKRRLEYPGGYLEVAYALLPEYEHEKFFSGKGKPWKEKHKQYILRKTMERVREMYPGSEWVIAPEFTVNETGKEQSERVSEKKSFHHTEELPMELKAAHLHSYAPFDQVGVAFSEDGGAFEGREAILLLAPYLRRMRQVILIGEDSPATELLSEYLYYEYGLPAERFEKIPQRYAGTQTEMLWIQAGTGNGLLSPALKTSLNFRWINRQETLKFLDTAVKNGYNTES